MTEETISQLQDARNRLKAEIAKTIVGQETVVDQLLIALFTGGHCLLTGAPGLAKTLLIQTVARLFELPFNRIQFTPDLMPPDITGSEILQESENHRALAFVKGPIFANIILADEINRTPPKTQAALLEAMQEKHVTAAGKTHELPKPFHVFATQNPIEMEGTYPLPEAQLDRFLFNIMLDYLSEDEEVEVITRTTSVLADPPEALFSGEQLLTAQNAIRQVPISQETTRYAVRLASATRPNTPAAPDFINETIQWGAGTRAAQTLVLGGKARALLDQRTHVTPDDIKALAKPTLRHRILLNYRAEAENRTPDDVVDQLLQHVQV